MKESCSARIFDEEANVTHRSAENYHEPLEASHGTRFMANEAGVSRTSGLFFVKIKCLVKLGFVIGRSVKKKLRTFLSRTLCERK